MHLRIHTDGGSKGNPGPAAIGIVIATKAGEELQRYREDIGTATNNDAEYTAVVRALELVRDTYSKDLERIDMVSDSELLVKQMNGQYKVKTPHIRDYVFKIRVLESELKVPITFNHVKREENKLADALVNDAA